MGGCSVLGCKKRVQKGHHFYRYPRNEKRKIWAEFTGRGTPENPWEPKDSNVICELHFEEHCLERKKSRLMPKKDAIPTIYSVETQTTQQKFIVTYPYSECSIPENFLPIEFSQAPKEANKKCKKEISDTKKAIKEEQKQIYDRKMKLEKLKLLCRFCAAKNSTIDIKNFDEFEIDVVLLMLNLEMKVEYNNYLSDAVCEDCFNHIIGYTSFKGMCKAAEDRILEELESLVPENVPKEYKNEQESSPTREEMKEEYLDYISNTSEIAEEGDYPDQEDSMEVPKDDPDQEDTIEVPRDDPFEPDTPREIREIDLNDLDAIDENVLIEEVHYEIVSINQDQAEPTNISEKIENDDQVHNVIYEIKDIKPNPIIKNEATNQYVLKVYECVFCKKSFGGKKTYKAHVCAIKEVSCDECDKVFNRPQTYKTHKANVHGVNKDKEYLCPMCKEVVQGSAANFIFHRKNCSKRNDPVECEICHKVLPTLTGYSIHKLFHDSMKNNGKSLFASTERGLCEICGKSYKTRRDYKVHMKIKHSGKNEVFQCEQCPKWFTNKPAFNQHKYNSHKVQMSTCSICNKVFRNKVLLRKHMIYHDEANRIHACSTCGKRFFTNVALNRHCLGHTSQKPYSCEICNNSYTTSQQLKQHREKNHKFHRVLLEDVECVDGEPVVYELYTESGENMENSEIMTVIE